MRRPPRSFDVEEPVATPEAPAVRLPRALDVPSDFVPADDAAAQRADDLAALEPPPPPPSARRFSFAKLLTGALGLLAALAVGLAVDELIRELFDRADWLGWLALGLGAVAAVALVAIVLRELLGLRRLQRISQMRDAAAAALADRDPKRARAFADELTALYAAKPETAAGRTALARMRGEIIDAPDVLALAERNILLPLDRTAQRMALDAAKRVSVVTAVSPRAFIDIAFVLLENLRLLRRIADLYGGLPGTLGFWRLARSVIAHLAVTGSIALGDSMIQQVVGHGVAARLSSRLGEGVVNGLLTARVGIAAIDVCRPMPFVATTRPGIGDFVAELTRREHKVAPSTREPPTTAER